MRIIIATLITVALAAPAHAGDGAAAGTLFAAARDRIMESSDLGIVERAEAWIEADRLLREVLGAHAETELAKTLSAGGKIGDFDYAAFMAEAALITPFSACAEPRSQGCIRALLDRAHEEARGIGDPSVSGESGLREDLEDAQVALISIEARDDERMSAADVADWALAATRMWVLALVAQANVAAGFPADGNAIVPEILYLSDQIVDDELLGYIVDAQVGLGFIDDAVVTSEHITDPELRSSALADIVPAMVGVGRVEEALRLADKIQDADAVSEIASRLAALVETSLTDADRSAIRQTVERLLSRDGLEYGLVNLAGILTKLGMSQQAYATAHWLENEYWRQQAFTKIVKAQIDAQMIDDALATAEMAPAMDEALRYIAEAQAAAGRIEEAKSTAARIDSPRERTDALHAIAQQELASGALASARTTLIAARDAAASIDYQGAENELYSGRLPGIALDLARAGFFDAAVETTAGMNFDDKRAETLAGIAELQFDAGLIAEATMTLEEAGAAAEGGVSALERVAEVQVKAGLVEEARETLIAALVRIAEGSFGGTWSNGVGPEDRVPRALALAGYAEDALTISSRIKDGNKQAAALTAIAKVEAEARHLPEAQAILKAASMAALTPKYESRRIGRLAKVGFVQAELGFIADARQTFETALSYQGIEVFDLFGDWADVDEILEAYVNRMLCISNRFGFVQFSARFDKIAAAQARSGLLDDALETAKQEGNACGRALSLASIAIALAEQRE